MKFGVDTTYRSQEIELMDDLNIGGALLYDTVDKIARINRLLGGQRAQIKGVDRLLKNIDTNQQIRIVDLGCGNGAMLRALALYGRKNKLKLDLLGLDANGHTVAYAEKLSIDFNEISYQKVDVFSNDFDTITYDIAIATLFIHHFNDGEISSLVQQLSAKANYGVIINDLHRHQLAYYLFGLFSLFYGNKMTRHDGAISILRGFKKQELVALAKHIDERSQISWKWAFRYQWFIKK